MLTLAFDKNHMSKYIKYIYVLIFFFSTTSNSYAACQPKFTLPEFPINNSSNQDLKNKVYVWYDASLSMSGFTKSQTDEINLYGPVINSLQKASQSLGTETSYNTFGSRFQTIDENRASLVTTQEFYKCTQSAQACAQKDRVNGISKVLNVAKKNQDSTVIIVTDLFLSTSETLAKNAEKIKSPLREIFNNGQSVGVFGISSSFNGKISGIPTGDGLGYASYSKATKRPFYIIVIGSGENINFIREKLENNQKLQDKLAEDPDAYHFSMITSNVIQTNLNVDKQITENNLLNISPQSEGYKFKYENNLPIYQFITSEKNFELEFNNSDFQVPGSNGVSDYKIDVDLWSSRETSCKDKNKWAKSKRENLVGDENITDETLSINVFEDTKLKWGYRWFTLLNIYTKKNGSSSQDLFKIWDLNESDAASYLATEPKTFKTLNMMNLMEMISDVANEEFQPTLVASIALNFELEK
jgi:CRISPR/Cas system CMR-associated protein Cmr5 small subunit